MFIFSKFYNFCVFMDKDYCFVGGKIKEGVLFRTHPLILFYFIYKVYISSTAACAAANLAIGTRKGEQLT